ncbi:MAG: nucleotidyltransferase domain-containing protein [Cyclobacteriaceae bacterium]|jgi:predicted nucleotidyltransferase|nr:nucleotidyltransferase domain-containing protein [Flammeovirgaceae bacterium]
MKELILNELERIERSNKVNILYSTESGSRAWGFPSPDSDYDVRFIYVHPNEDYLSVDEHRDVIELPINNLLDINGWELRKTLRLLRKSNAPLFEWLQSPVVYRQDDHFVSEMRKLMPYYFSPRATMHHYLSMASNVLNNELIGEQVKLKKYFYALRPMLAARWILEFDQVPPMEFSKLRDLLDASVNQSVEELLAIKANADESYLIEKSAALNEWLVRQLAFCEERVPVATPTPDSDPLNELFRKFVA